MNLNLDNLKQKYFSVGSYLSFNSLEDRFLLDSKNSLTICHIQRGSAVLFQSKGNKFIKISDVKKDDVIIVNDFVGKIEFKASTHLTSIELILNNISSNEIKNLSPINLGKGDITIEKSTYHIPANEIVHSINRLSSDLSLKNVLCFSSNSNISSCLTRLIDLLNSNRLKFHSNYFTEIIIAELLFTLEEKFKDLLFGNDNITKIISYIDRHYTEELSLKSIADNINMNVSYMQKLFKDKMGNTVYDYLNQYRINQAVSLMKSTTLPLIDIAIEVGFSNRQTFYNVFKSFMGYTPKTFRKFLSSGDSITDFK